MKNILSLFMLVALVTISSCGDKKTDKKPDMKQVEVETKKEAPKAIEEPKGDPELIAKGQKLFIEKTCATCHLPNKKVIGPSIKDINKIYTENDTDIVAFLKGELDPIVDKDPGQVAVMKANLDGFVKGLNDDELNALKAYMESVK